MIILAALILASHGTGPYDWHMSCDRWQQRAIQIMADEKISHKQRRFLVRYLRTKVEGECTMYLTNSVRRKH